jgi:hypothetical protein
LAYVQREEHQRCCRFDADLVKVLKSKGNLNPELPFTGTNLDGNHVGDSAIYFLQPNFHFMLKHPDVWTSQLLWDGRKDNQFFSYISPGFRWAPLTRGETQ